jgi:hypothetical protein
MDIEAEFAQSLMENCMLDGTAAKAFAVMHPLAF